MQLGLLAVFWNSDSFRPAGWVGGGTRGGAGCWPIGHLSRHGLVGGITPHARALHSGVWTYLVGWHAARVHAVTMVSTSKARHWPVSKCSSIWSRMVSCDNLIFYLKVVSDLLPEYYGNTIRCTAVCIAVEVRRIQLWSSPLCCTCIRIYILDLVPSAYTTVRGASVRPAHAWPQLPEPRRQPAHAAAPEQPASRAVPLATPLPSSAQRCHCCHCCRCTALMIRTSVCDPVVFV